MKKQNFFTLLFAAVFLFAISAMTVSCSSSSDDTGQPTNPGGNNPGGNSSGTNETSGGNNSGTSEDTGGENNNGGSTEITADGSWLIGDWNMGQVLLQSDIPPEAFGLTEESDPQTYPLAKDFLSEGKSLLNPFFYGFLEEQDDETFAGLGQILHATSENKYTFKEDNTFEVDGNSDFIFDRAEAEGSWKIEQEGEAWNLILTNAEDQERADTMEIWAIDPDLELDYHANVSELGGDLPLTVVLEKP